MLAHNPSGQHRNQHSGPSRQGPPGPAQWEGRQPGPSLAPEGSSPCSPACPTVRLTPGSAPPRSQAGQGCHLPGEIGHADFPFSFLPPAILVPFRRENPLYVQRSQSESRLLCWLRGLCTASPGQSQGAGHPGHQGHPSALEDTDPTQAGSQAEAVLGREQLTSGSRSHLPPKLQDSAWGQRVSSGGCVPSEASYLGDLY